MYLAKAVQTLFQMIVVPRHFYNNSEIDIQLDTEHFVMIDKMADLPHASIIPLTHY